MMTHPSRSISVMAYAIMGALLLALITVLVAAFLMIRPYNEANIDHPSNLVATEYTSDGEPVIEVGEPLAYTTNLCNDGVDITALRFIDHYVDSKRVAARTVSSTEFFIDEPRCVEGVAVEVVLPLHIPTEAHYKLRTENSYSPNFLRTITNTTETEMFYYIDEGDKIP